MHIILKYKWFILALWLTVSGVLFFMMPNIGELVRDKGQIEIPDDYSSSTAKELLEEYNDKTEDSSEMSTIIVFYNEEVLTDGQWKEIDKKIEHLERDKEKLGINSITSHNDSEEMYDQLVSKDETTVLTNVMVERGDRSKAEVVDALNAELDDMQVEHYLTGSQLINDDFVKTTQTGVKKTESVAVIFILVVLVIVFRSPITPIASLLSVAVSYVVSIGIVSQLVENVNFPFSNFTQIFLILILFGIGTDYNILLMMRFKEELSKQETIFEAINHTYKTAGKTVLYSGLAVFIGFSVLGLAQFKLFKSASAVGIGVAVLILVLYTIVPILMFLLKEKLFWPSKKINSHEGNKFTSAVTSFAVKRPIIGILFTFIIIIPFIFLYNGELSYNSIDEIDEGYSSVKGISIVNKHFPAGQALPASIVMQHDKSLNSSESLAFIDEITESISNIEGVDTVYSVTRPRGEKIPELYTKEQASLLSDGVETANDGIKTVQDGLTKAVDDIEAAPTEDFDKVEELINGTKELQDGVTQATNAIASIDSGITSGAESSQQLAEGVGELNSNLEELIVASGKLEESIQQIKDGYTSIYTEYEKLAEGINGLLKPNQTMAMYMESLERKYDQLSQDKDFLALKQTNQAMLEQLQQITAGFTTLNQQFYAINEQLISVQTAINQLSNGQQAILGGSETIEKNLGELSNGLTKAQKGQAQVLRGMPNISAGLDEVNKGQIEMDKGLDTLQESLGTLEEGLMSGADGLGDIHDGLTSVQNHLDALEAESSTETFYIPEEVRTGEAFKASIDTYMNDDKSMTRWVIILAEDPYSKEAINIMEEIDDVFLEKIKQFEYADVNYGISGIASENRDLNNMSTGDFTKTASIMLIGILIVLFIITRSFWIPLFIIGSLMLAYYGALSSAELIFKEVTEYQNLTWTIPFFSFIMVVALGVDYSIFLIMRYLEYQDSSPKEAIQEAMKKTGGVIISAVVILSGTFAAMYPSGVLTLTQLATVVIIALLLLSFLFLPLFLPALIALSNRRKEE